MSIIERISQGEIVASFDLQVKDNQKIVYNLLQNKQESLKDNVGKKFDFVAYFVTTATYENKNSTDETESKKGIKICLLSSAGTWYSASGMAILNSVESFEKIFGVMSEENPFTAEVCSVQSDFDRNRKYISLQM